MPAAQPAPGMHSRPGLVSLMRTCRAARARDAQ